MKIEVPHGEVVDKVTILSIKLAKITDPDKLSNVRREYDLLSAAMEGLGITPRSREFTDLRSVNLELWEIEDRIRKLEAAGDFGEDFVECARSVYRLNDTRARLKREINRRTGSLLVEEKEYADYSE
ncbi:MAG TPA: DUF6165 family protein [Candidatus Sabulitectum sp.]|nr:DUF6165 family protein [Candidatus Sabulitectum sp.]HPJ27706.1 DUF6165 family protein [Candidatus Sabulitectum sp.]HPR22336.1 DUF6165 family protein [Candidatus Sabulitectum sp.]